MNSYRIKIIKFHLLVELALFSIFFISPFLSSSVSIEPKVEWDKTFGGPETEYGWSVDLISDDGFIIAGSTESFGSGSNDAWVIKTDSLGNIEWSKTFGGEKYDILYSLKQNPDGSYIGVGKTSSFNSNSSDLWVIKLDSGGNIAWNKTFGGIDGDSSRSIAATNDGGCIILGNTGYYGRGESDGMLVKLNPEGVIEWNKTFGGADDDLGFAVEQTNDNGYIISGGTWTNSVGLLDLWVVKTDFKENIEWTKTIGGTDYDGGYSIRQVNDNEYIICGTTASYGEGKTDIWLVKLGLEVLASKTSSMSSIFSTIILLSTALVIKLKKKK
ncbi:MAG: hypothetical protein K9W46_02555 [Candidatus Heimdallarchaeum endolithica]|uniref:Bulb-type lectin domain-containing protein n=1 Tax=Candidatus Heimdallarchaeum endolithica TaxID=2876572 RepID=A0A9Y1BS57_9ARCH|nr:MAG: hypothetical protein K9W46_02555 [Candidatus Heimdallarchaeum endolithica]